MGSLQTRLAVWLAGSVLLVFLVHWPAANRLPALIAEQYVTTRLAHDAEILLAGLTVDASGHPLLEPGSVEPVYDRPLSGHYYVVQGPGDRLRSPSLMDTDLHVPVPPVQDRPSVERRQGPAGQPLLVWSATFQIDGQPVQLLLAEDLTPLETYREDLHYRVALVTVALLLVLTVVQGLVVRWSLRPLDRVREDCRLLAASRIDRLREDVPAEVRPLVSEVNRLLQVLGQRADRSRLALANLAHAVKTPLTVLTQALGDCEGGVATPEVRHAVERIQDAVTRELKLARLAGPSAAGSSFAPAEELPQLVEVLRQVHRERGLTFQVSGLPGSAIPGEREDLLELFGNLLDNAAKWARSRVALTFQAGPGLCFCVEDDGPGVSVEALDRLPQRGVRLDQAVEGEGIGLAVCREIVDQYRGTLTLSPSAALGGLRVEVRLPAR